MHELRSSDFLADDMDSHCNAKSEAVLGKGRMASTRLVSLDLQISESMLDSLAWLIHDIRIVVAAYICGTSVFVILSIIQR